MPDGEKDLHNIPEYRLLGDSNSKLNGYDKVVSIFSTILIAINDYHHVIYVALKELGIFTGAGYAYIFQFDKLDTAVLNNTYEWYPDDVLVYKEKNESMSIDKIPYLLKKIHDNEIIYVNDTGALPLDAQNEKELLKRKNVKSLLLVPIFIKNRLAGFSGFDNVTNLHDWSDLNIKIIQMFAQVISSLLEKKTSDELLIETNQELVRNEKQLRAINYQLSSSEDHLLIVQKRLAAAMEAGGLAWWAMSVSSGILECDERRAIMLGYEPAELKEKHFNEMAEMIHADDREKVISAMKDYIDGRKDLYEAEYRVRCRDGSFIWFYDRGAVSLRGRNGNPILITGTVTDITIRKKTSDELHKTEKRLGSIINSINDVVWSIIQIPELKIEYISPAVKRIFGRDAVDFENDFKLWIDCVHPEDRKTIVDAFRQLERKDHAETRRRIIRPDGTIRWIRDRGWNIYDEKGDITRIDGIVSDITEQVLAEDALRESEIRFRAIVENSHNAICIVNEQGKISWTNNRVMELSGYTSDQLLSAESFMVFISPESKEFVLQNFRKFFNNQEYQNHSIFEFIRADGQKRITEKHMTDFTDKYGKRNLIVSMLDITDLKQAEKSLRENESRWRSYVEHAPYGIFITNGNGECIQANTLACRMTGYSEEELKNMSILDLIEEKLRNEVANIIKQLYVTEEFVNEMKYLNKAGEERWWAVAVVKIANDMCLIYAGDISKRKQAEYEHRQLEIQLRHSQKMDSIGQLAAGIAHEINNPVGFVLGNSETIIEYVESLKKIIDLFDSGATPEIIEQKKDELDIRYILGDVDSLLEDNLNGLHRIKEIVTNLKDFARIETAGKYSEADLEENIKKTLAIVNNEIKYNSEVVLQFGRITKICCNIGEINQVFLNIIVNAAQAIKEQNRKEKGHITIKTYEDKISVYCDISDDGPGIPDKIITRIFDPFFTTKEVGKGTGLGLSIAYDIIVNKHKGEFKVRNVDDHGACFSIRLPKNKPGD